MSAKEPDKTIIVVCQKFFKFINKIIFQEAQIIHFLLAIKFTVVEVWEIFIQMPQYKYYFDGMDPVYL